MVAIVNCYSSTVAFLRVVRVGADAQERGRLLCAGGDSRGQTGGRYVKTPGICNPIPGIVFLG
jgi:hypothetical protein